LLNEVEKLAHRTGAAVVISHHFAKGSAAGKDSKDRVSGSGVWARDPDALVTITPHETEGAFTIEATLRNFAPREAFVVKWEWPLLRPSGDLDPTQLKQAPGGRPREHTAASLLATLPDEGATFTAWRDIAVKSGFTESTFKRLSRELRETNDVATINGLYCRTGRTSQGGAK